ncbi:type II toxin-antitoxin system HipA family toxin [Isoptericola halotolerans]|uniref:type II toxin-antitoxin system HipA family toxin n=1 Tax=Isoptericola halotolerans TaxID=300560 RepID=UPI00388E45AC
MSRAGVVQIDVRVELSGDTVRAGTAYITEWRGTTSTSFVYDPTYLGRRDAFSISPDLPVAVSRHQVAGLPGAVADTAPDRWGRNLIDKQVRYRARDDHAPATIREVDYLLGVADLTRQDALRYTTADDVDFLAPDPHVPRLIELPRLMRAAESVASDSDDLAEVELLLDAGTGSLGGARPKASVRDGHQLQIAKFPHPGDRWDVMAWEMTMLDLAEQAGIRVPGRRLLTVDGRSVLVLDRFDRDGRGRRLAYASAMSLVGGVDGASFDYLEVAESLATHGSDVTADLRELWLRALFFTTVNNTDDHLRNHGFLHTRGGWRLAPAFDVNPDLYDRAPATSIGFVSADRVSRFEALIDVAAEFGMSAADAGDAMDVVAAVVDRWREAAARNGIGERELQQFRDVFDSGTRLVREVRASTRSA